MAISPDLCRGATFSYVRGRADPVASRLSEDAAHKMLCELRWENTDGAPVCPHCGCPDVYTYWCRRVFKCKACHRQFSATSGTLLAYRKLPFRILLMALSLFVNAAKGLSRLQLNLGLHAKTAFVLFHSSEAVILRLK
jgi:transposase-like protein